MKWFTLLLAAVLTATPARTDDLTETVTLMARVGRSWGGTFSPDGKRVAFVSDLNGVPQVWIVPVEGGFPRQVTAGDDPVTAVVWSPASERLAFQLAPAGGMNSQIYVVQSDGSGKRLLTEGGRTNNWLGDWTEDGARLTVASNRRTPDAMDAYLVDAATGQPTLVARNTGIGSLSSTSRDASRAILDRLVSRGSNDLYLLDLPQKREVLLTPHAGPGDFQGKLAQDGRAVYLLFNTNRDLAAFGRITLSSEGSPGPIELLAERPDAELDGFELNHAGTQAVLAWNVAGRTEADFIDLRTGHRGSALRLPSELASDFTFSRDDARLAFTAWGSATPLDVWVMDVGSGRSQQLTFSPHPGVKLDAFVRPELVHFPAHDGLELSGWLYRPTRNSASAYVVSFHGGPEGQERPSFRSDYQALLANGIGVLAPNIRGSSGFGKRFVNLDNGELRFNANKDIKACADYLRREGIADPKRIGIMGGSYGGYVTMVGVTEYPDLFAAGADLYGMVNFATFFQHTEPWMAAISTKEYGDPATQAELLARLSPLGKLDRIKAPLIVLHGAHDTNVPVVEAEQIVDNLKARGVPVEYVLFPDEGHGWRKTANRIRSTVEIVRFFNGHLKGEPLP